MIVKNDENVVAMFDVQLPKNTLIATPEIQDKLNELHKLEGQIELIKNRQEELIKIVKSFMGDKEELRNREGNREVTYKLYEGKFGLDLDKLKKSYPDVYVACMTKKAKDIRRFCLK